MLLSLLSLVSFGSCQAFGTPYWPCWHGWYRGRLDFRCVDTPQRTLRLISAVSVILCGALCRAPQCPEETPVTIPYKTLLAIALCVLGYTAPAAAAGVSCHCFRDRSFDAASPAAVDPYLLATTQNSLLAAVFGVPKKDVMRAKMTGADGGRLWVAHFLARNSGGSAEEWLAARGKTASWAEAAAQRTVPLPPALQAAGADAGDTTLATAVVDLVLTESFGVTADILAPLRRTGAGDAETIAAVYLGLRRGEPPASLLTRVRAGETTWGSLLHATGLAPEQIDEDLPKRLH